MATMEFTTKIIKIGDALILKLPLHVSASLPSRGLTMVRGTMNRIPFQTALEPDGNNSHWFKVTRELSETANVQVNDTVNLSIQPSSDWPEPKVPSDIEKALKTDADAKRVWQDITPMARWDWIRWIGATKQAETRKRRIEVMCSKLNNGKRRPCCFNRTECTDPLLSKNGKLFDATV